MVDKVLAVLIARGGSKGIPGKNLALVDGKPMISLMTNTAMELAEKGNFDFIVSTDSPEIRQVVVELGAWAPFLRPKELAQDHVASLPVVQHAVDQAERINQTIYDGVVYLQPTSPLCRGVDIIRCVQALRDDESAESAVAVTEVETHPFRMKRLLHNGYLVNYIDQGFEDMRPRQELPKVYRRAGSVYVSRRFVVMEKGTLVGDPCIGVMVPAEAAIDVDSEIDLELVRILSDKADPSRETSET